MRDPVRDFENTRDSVDVFGEHPDDPVYQRLSRDREAFATGLYTRTFLQDVQYVVPFPRMDENFEATLAGHVDDDVRRLVTEALPGRYMPWPYRTLTEAYRDFSARCVQAVVASGQAAYEIVYYLPDAQTPPTDGAAAGVDAEGDSHPVQEDQPSKPVAFRLLPVRPYVMRPGGRPYQYVPSLETEEVILGDAEPQPPRWIELDPDRLVVFTLPQGRRRQVARVWHGLLMANRFHGVPTTLMFDDAPGYDFGTHQRIADETVGRITRPVGWNVRRLLDRQLETYQLYRQLHFVRFKLELRDMVTATLNEAMAKAGGHMGFDASIELRGVPTLDDVDAALSELQEGPSGELVGLYERFRPL